MGVEKSHQGGKRGTGTMIICIIVLLACSCCYGEVIEIPSDAKESTGIIEESPELLKIEQPIEEGVMSIGESLGRIIVVMGQSKLVTTKEDVKRVSINSPEMATVTVVSPRQILLDAKEPGTTTLIIWDTTGKTFIYDLTVQRDVALLEQYLKELDEGIDIELFPVRDTVILWGEVDTPGKITKAIMMAASFFGYDALEVVAGPGGTIASEGYKPHPLKFADTGGGTATGERTIAFEEVNRVWNVADGAIIATKNGKVISFLRLKYPLQVELQVRFVQVELNLLKEYGFDNIYDAFRFDQTKTGFETNTTTLTQRGSAPTGLTPSGVLRYFLIHRSDHVLFDVQLRALENNSIVKVLSEPNLTVISGQEATFMVGGEFPVLVPQQSSTTIGQPFFTVEWKVFGNKLELIPEVKENSMINLRLIPEVSERSEELGVDFPTGGQIIRIPGLKTRRVETAVELREEDSLVIAGLLLDKETFITRQVPFLGNIPGLGIFFRDQTKKKERTELMIVITPKLVKPMSPKEAKEVAYAGRLGEDSVYGKFLKKKFKPIRWLVGPFGYQ